MLDRKLDASVKKPMGEGGYTGQCNESMRLKEAVAKYGEMCEVASLDSLLKDAKSKLSTDMSSPTKNEDMLTPHVFATRQIRRSSVFRV